MKRFGMRIPDDLHQQTVKAAQNEHRSLNTWLLFAVRHYLRVSQKGSSIPPSCRTCGTPFPRGHVCSEQPQQDLREEIGARLRHWGLLDEIAEPEATEYYAVTDILTIFNDRKEQQ